MSVNIFGVKSYELPRLTTSLSTKYSLYCSLAENRTMNSGLGKNVSKPQIFPILDWFIKLVALYIKKVTVFV